MTAYALRILEKPPAPNRNPNLACNHNRTRKRGIENLSPKEHQVAVMLASGLLNKEIAFRLGNSTKTISTYRERIFWKLSVGNHVQLTHLLLARGKMPNLYANEPNG